MGDICPTFLDGDWIESKDQSDSGVRLIQTGNIGVGTYIEKEDRAKWVSKDTFNRLHCEEVFAGDILISRLPEPAGRACIVPETGLKMITAVDVTIARTSDEYDSNFILQFLCSDNYFKAVGNTLSGSTRQRISRSNLEQIPVPIAPTMQEQEQVGAFFSQLDNLITLHQRKCDALQKFKKSMLQKMFPQNGESVPEIRFAGFTDAWEQRKVGDVLSESRDAGHSGDIAKKLTVKLWGKGVYAKNDKGSAATQYFTRHAGQFIYSKLDFLNSAFGVVPQELESYESTADLPAFDCIAVDPYFMFYRAIQPSFYLTNGMIADGSRKAKRIHVETLLDMPLDLPSIEEQKKVASYFTQLDSLITLHQRKLETLQKMKKSLLQKMFV